jgi:hypothetical protein
VARVVAFVPDLLFGSNLIGALQAAGHETTLSSTLPEPIDADVLIVDLTACAGARIEQLRGLDTRDVRTLAFYAHVEAEVRARAEEAGFDLVVPRSRMAREAAALIERLLDD